MKSTELRIGNHFYLTLDGEEDELCVCDKYDFEDEIETWNRKIGIPLTEERLLKFGAAEIGKSSISGGYNYHIGKIDIFGIYDKSEFYLNHMGLDKVQIKHVHSLQNLYFALTGEELTTK